MSDTVVRADLSGVIWCVEVQAGDRVEEDQVLMIVESMKMEIPVTSPAAGTVIEVRVKKGDAVKEGEPVALIHRD